MRGFNLSAWSVRNPALMLFLMLAVAVAGVLAFLSLGRAEDPPLAIRGATIFVGWPGATSSELQDLVVDPIEKKLRTLPHYDHVRTYTVPGEAVLDMEFDGTAPPSSIPELFYQTRKRLDDLRPDLPAGIVGPTVNDEFGDVDSILYAVTAPGADYDQLKQVADALRRDLERVPDAVKVEELGLQNQRIFVELSHAKLATLGVPARAIFDSLARQNAVTPAGVVETAGPRVPVRVTGALHDAASVGETPVQGNGQVFRLRDIATVRHGFEDPPSLLVRQDGQPAVLVGVVMRQRANILDLGRQVDAAVAAFEAKMPVGFALTRVADQPTVVHRAVGEFLRSFAEALVIVLAVSFLSLGWRAGLVVACSVPLVLAVVFVAMQAMGLDLHRVTLGALIIALGLLVDDAIIAVEMMAVKLEQGWDRVRAAGHAWTTTAFPMLTGTLVTATGFMPVGLANSQTGEYVGAIFWVTGIALVTSWFVAVAFTPLIGARLLRPAAAPGQSAATHDGRLYRALRRMVGWCLRRRRVVVGGTALLFVFAAGGFATIQQQFFPITDRPELFMQVRMPTGTAIAVTDRAAREAEALLHGDPDVAALTTYVGQGPARFWLGLNPQQPDTAYAELVILSRDLAARERIKARLDHAIADGALAAARIRVHRFEFGPPVANPVEFRVTGTDPLTVRRFAYAVRDAMRANPDAVDPNLDWNERAPSVRLEIDQDRARALGLTPAEIGQSLQTLLQGTIATTIRDGTEAIDVVVRATPAERVSLDHIGDLTITTTNGVAVPVSQVARVRWTSEEPILWRRDRNMAITVRADVRDGVQAPDVTNAIWPTLAGIRAEMPPGYGIEIGGAIEESGKANASIIKLFPAMTLIMLGILMVQVRSFSRLALTVLTAPLGLIGASLALNLSGRPFGFVALLGLIALAGMIMRNTVILIDQIERDRADGLAARAAIIEATVRRARPVVLTALAAILAMIPLAPSLFWGPMAFVIGGGLFVATFLTLLFLPALYALWSRLDAPMAARAPALAAVPAE